VTPPETTLPGATENLKTARQVGIICAVIGALLFSTKPILIKLAYAEGADAITLLIARMALSLPFYLIIGILALRRRQDPLPPRSAALALGLGVIGYHVASYLDFEGLNHISAQLERMILYIYPTFVAALAWLIHKERPTRRLILALLAAYAGVALVFGHDLSLEGDQVIKGSLLVLASALAFAVYVNGSKGPIATLGPPLFTSIAMIGAIVTLCIQFALTRDVTSALSSLSADVWWLALVMAIFATVIPSLLVSEGIARLGPSSAAVIGGIGPIATSGFAVLILAEPFTAFHVGGLVLAVFGVSLLAQTPKPLPGRTPPR
jgi:drug/metabolite transporter (DMT)-like permease